MGSLEELRLSLNTFHSLSNPELWHCTAMQGNYCLLQSVPPVQGARESKDFSEFGAKLLDAKCTHILRIAI